ncbi:hypothetical protein TgHK011_007372 [Trichoderma gracile]|nr:hypothetical protein TgHK011_007372 [Trichoderma gracile]
MGVANIIPQAPACFPTRNYSINRRNNKVQIRNPMDQMQETGACNLQRLLASAAAARAKSSHHPELHYSDSRRRDRFGGRELHGRLEKPSGQG